MCRGDQTRGRFDFGGVAFGVEVFSRTDGKGSTVGVYRPKGIVILSESVLPRVK